VELLPGHPTRKDAFTALLVLDTIISASDSNEKIVKAMNDIQESVSKILKQSLKQRSIEPYFNPLKPNGIYVPTASTITNSSFCIHGFHMIFTVNSYYFLEQH
jgi:hypothetical protein